MGAGDGRFATEGRFTSYQGVEIDRRFPLTPSLPQNASMSYGCIFRYPASEYSACIGNPPYVRHHDIESDWQERVLDSIEAKLGLKLDKRANLFLYFICLGIIKTRQAGLISMVIPFEWVSRPSSKALREFLVQQGWAVTVYRFKEPIFPSVLTTSSITVIDKSKKSKDWKFFDIDGSLRVSARGGMSGTKQLVLAYENRTDIWALRGLSPGSQTVFTLTEWERLHHGLTMADVRPCVTTLRRIPSSLSDLDADAFRRHFVEAGQRCWLVRSDRKLSARLQGYLAGAPADVRNNYTCQARDQWYKYALHPTPKLLISSGFVTFGPKVLINSIGATAVGSVYGVHARKPDLSHLRRYLKSINFEERVVPHAAKLKKIEVKQLNAVLNNYGTKLKDHGR